MTTIPFRMAMVIPGGIDKMEFKIPDRLLPFALRFEFAVESLFVRGGGGFVGFCLCVFYVLFAGTGEAE